MLVIYRLGQGARQLLPEGESERLEAAKFPAGRSVGGSRGSSAAVSSTAAPRRAQKSTLNAAPQLLPSRVERVSSSHKK